MGDYTDGYGNRTPHSRYYCIKHKRLYELWEKCPECEKERMSPPKSLEGE